MFGCRQCDFDWCQDCYKEHYPAEFEKANRRFKIVKPKKKKHNAEAGICIKALRTDNNRYNCDKCDPKDTVKFPKGTLMWGCRECDFDWCGDCFKVANPEVYELDMDSPIDGIVEREKEGHGANTTPKWKCLKPFRVPRNNAVNCDKCDKRGKEMMVKGQLAWGCEACDWDCCALCYAQINQSQFEADVKAHGGMGAILPPKKLKKHSIAVDVGEANA
jgi:ribosomal protein L37AE/L43A